MSFIRHLLWGETDFLFALQQMPDQVTGAAMFHAGAISTPLHRDRAGRVAGRPTGYRDEYRGGGQRGGLVPLSPAARVTAGGRALPALTGFARMTMYVEIPESAWLVLHTAAPAGPARFRVTARASDGAPPVALLDHQAGGDAWTEQKKLTASDGAANDRFRAYRWRMSGDTALAGAHGDDGFKGSAYVFVRSGDTWTEQKNLTASDGAVNDSFGYSVALSTDTALVGAAKGAAYPRSLSALLNCRISSESKHPMRLPVCNLHGLCNHFESTIGRTPTTARRSLYSIQRTSKHWSLLTN